MSETLTVQTEAPEEAKPQEEILILPGHLFFVESIKLPGALEAAEMDDFAELSLEGLAPFPVEQLRWGFLHSDASDAILLYATHQDRLKSLGHGRLDSYAWVLPDFATLDGAHFPKAATLLLEGDDSSSRIELPAGEGLPQSVTSRPEAKQLPATTTTDAALRLQLLPPAVSAEGLLTFHFEAIDPAQADAVGHWRELQPAEAALWRADVRDGAFKAAERNNRRLTNWVTRATLYASLFALLLLLFEGLLFAGVLWVDARHTRIEAQTPEALRIQDKQSLMNKLDQVAQNELRPIAILSALNRSRPKNSIHFNSAVIEGQNRITIDGVATTINELNAYVESLRQSGTFAMVDDPRYLTRGGKTTFSITFDYDHSATQSDAAPAGSPNG